MSDAKPAVKQEPEYKTTSDIPVEPVYSPSDLGGWDYNSAVGFPGEYPFTRGP